MRRLGVVLLTSFAVLSVIGVFRAIPAAALGVPTVSGVSPASGPVAGGTAVTITGTNFASGDTVSFGGAAATGVAVNSATSITANAPAGNAQNVGGTVDVTVTGPGGTSPTSPADEYTYIVSSSTYSISLAASTPAPAVGASVTLTATANKDIGPTPYGMSIVDASTGAIVSHVGSGSSFTATVSESSAMTQRYVAEIDNAGGVNIQANSSPVIVTWGGTPPPAPTVSGVSPASGPASGGTTVTVTGTNFGSGDTVAFGGSAATGVVVNSATSITATSPSGTGTVDVTVTGPGGTSAASSADQFTYAAAAGVPTVSAVTPTSGPVSAGSSGQPPITRETPYFPVSSETLGDNSIMINPEKVGDLVVLSMQLHTTGISITGITGGNVGNWQRALTYTNTGTDTLYYEVWWGVATSTGPSTVSIAYSADVSQWAIELIADSFTTASTLPWAVVTSGGSSNPSSTTASWPALTSNNLADQLYWGASEEESNATSSPTPGFTSDLTSHGNCFVYDGGLAPSTRYAPTCGESPADVSTAVGVIFSAGSASASGGGASGTPVTITGTNFAAGDTVSFGGGAATGVVVNSPTSITADAPPGNASIVGGTVDVTVTGPGGTSPTSPADEFTYIVSSSTYSISLAASTTAPAVGGSVTLTATANKDIGSTPYGMSIVDASTGVILSHVGSGSSFSVTVSQSAAMTQRYVAEIDNAGGVNIQANSSPVIVTWS
jgi:IPT/TIG domain